ncbi:MAG: hypothetical protein JXC85_05005, partial [Candidatus Aenigmarchaeota archaeon]|nr:hypothetical protein [Candidatus Aenigmarchaeota archaeon]
MLSNCGLKGIFVILAVLFSLAFFSYLVYAAPHLSGWMAGGLYPPEVYREGWGTEFNFTVEVSEDDNDNVNLTLWLKKGLTGNWILADYDYDVPLPGGENKTLYMTFTKYDISEWQGKFNATNTTGAVNESGIFYFVVEKDDTLMEYASGDNTAVNRSGNQMRYLSMKVNDTDRNVFTNDSIVIFNVTENITIQSHDIFLARANYSVPEYYVELNPDCGYSVGNHTWNMGVSPDDSYYKNSMSSDYNVKVYGDLSNDFYDQDHGSGYDLVPGAYVTIRGNVTDDCGVLLSNASVRVWFNMTDNRTGDRYRCPSTGSQYASMYPNMTFYCNWDIAPPAVNNESADYTVEMYSEPVNSSVYYNDGYDTEPNVIHLNKQVGSGISCSGGVGGIISVVGGDYTCENIYTAVQGGSNGCSATYLTVSGNYYYFHARVIISSDGSPVSSNLTCTNKHIRADYYWLVHERGILQFGELLEGMPQEGCLVEGSVSSLTCDSAAICAMDYPATTAVPGGQILLYDTTFRSIRAAGNKQNIDPASNSANHNGGAGQGTQRLVIRRFTFEGPNACGPPTTCTANCPIMYVPEDSDIDDYAASYLRYGMELTAFPSKSVQNIQIHHAQSGIRMCQADAKVSGYYGFENCVDVKMGGPTLIAEDSNISTDPPDHMWDQCGAGGYTNRYVLLKNSFTANVKDTGNNPITSVNVTAIDVRGDPAFNNVTNSNGKILEQLVDYLRFITRANVGTSSVPVTDQDENHDTYTTHTFYYKKYGYRFLQDVADMSIPKDVDKVLLVNPYINITSQAAAKSQTGIIYTPPTKVTFSDGEEEDVSSGTINLNGYPVCQSEYTAMLQDELQTDGSGSGDIYYQYPPISSANYTVNWTTGVVNFTSDYNGETVRSVYSYGGSIRVTSNRTLSNIYDYVQANLNDTFTTDTGSIYTSYVDVILGNSTVHGRIASDVSKTLNIEDGYGFSAGSLNGSTVNIQSDTWNYRDVGGGGTLFRKYTLDVLVKDSKGDPIDNATLTMLDKDDQLAYGFPVYTASDGTVHVEVVYAEYDSSGSRQFSQGTDTFTLSVSKFGYATHTESIAMDRESTREITLTSVCDPSYAYTYGVLAGDGEQTNRSADAPELTLSAIVYSGMTVESDNLEPNGFEIKAPKASWTSRDQEPGEQQAKVGDCPIFLEMLGLGGGQNGDRVEEAGPENPLAIRNDFLSALLPEPSFSLLDAVYEEEHGPGADLTVMNVQSYPPLHGNWTVSFNTTGTSDLTISAVDGTGFGNDIDFLELRCGDVIKDYEWVDGSVFVRDYICEGTGNEVSRVLTSGKHTLEFRFGDDVEYAHNQVSNFLAPYQDITPGGTGWTEDVDLSSYIPLTATGVMVMVSDDGGGAGAGAQIRKGDSTQDLSTYSHLEDDCNMILITGVDDDKEIDIYQGNSNWDYYLIGYFDSEVFFTDYVDVSPGSSTGWVVIDVSSYVPAGATGVIINVQNVDTSNDEDYMIRPVGSGDDRSIRELEDDAHAYWAVMLDSSRSFQIQRDSTDVRFYLVGYTPANPTGEFYLNYTLNSFHPSRPGSGDTWTAYDAGDLGIPDEAVGFIAEADSASDYGVTLRMNSSTGWNPSVNYYDIGGGTHVGLATGLTGTGGYEYKVESTSYGDIWIWAYFLPVLKPTLDGLTLDAPTTDIQINKGESFDMNCTPLVGAPTGVNLTFRYNYTGESSFIDIPESGPNNVTPYNMETDVGNGVRYDRTVSFGTSGIYYVSCQIYNSTSTLDSNSKKVSVLGPPIVSLDEPGDGESVYSQLVTLTCSGTDEIFSVVNATLYGNWTGAVPGWGTNGTNISGINGEFTFARVFPSDGDYEWNCYVCNDQNKCAFADQNSTFRVWTTEANTSWVDYNFTDSYDFPNVSEIRIKTQVSYYLPNGSRDAGNTRPDLEIRLWNGSGYVAGYLYGVENVMGSDADNTTDTNFTISVTDQSVLDAWQAASNRNMSIRLVYGDTVSGVDDIINWTGVWATLYYGPDLDNDGPSIWVNYTVGGSDFDGNVTQMLVQARISYYNPTGSYAASNKRPDLEVRVWNGTDYVTGFYYHINDTMGSDAENVTTTDFELNLTDSVILDAWKYSANRSLSVRGVYFDSGGGPPPNNDTIIYSGMWVTLNSDDFAPAVGQTLTLYVSKVGTGSGATWDSGHVLTTDGNGTVSYNFTATCNDPNTTSVDEEYEVGAHNWYIEITTEDDDYLCQDSQSEYYDFDVTGALENFIVFPDGTKNYTSEDTILLQGYVNNYCGEPITTSVSNVWYNLTSGNYKVSCTGISRSGANVYYCNWKPTQESVQGWYNVSMHAEAANYWSNDTTIFPPNDTFFLFTEPKLYDANVTPRSQPWGKNYNFTLKVKDNMGDTVNITLKTQVLGGSWELIGYKNCTSCSNNSDNYTMLYWDNVNYSCTGYADKYMKFRFEALDNESNVVYTDILNPGDYWSNDDTFFIEKHNVTIHYIFGNETSASPSSPGRFILRINDTDMGTFSLLDTMTLAFNVTKTGVGSGDYKNVGTGTSNSTGHVTYYFTPDGDFQEGKQNWIGYVDMSETCYNYNESGVYNVSVQPGKYIYLENSTVDPITGEWGSNFSFNVTSKTNSQYYINFSLRIDSSPTGSFDEVIESHLVNVTGEWKTINFSWDPECGDKGTKYFKIKGDDYHGNVNYTTVQTFTVERDTVLLRYLDGNKTESRRGKNQTTFLVNATDLNGSQILGLNVTFYVMRDISTWDSGAVNSTNGSGIAMYDFLAGCSPKYGVGYREWKAVIEDDACYKDNSTADSYYLIVNITGDIQLEFSKPDGDTNYTQEQKVPFLGATWDDCSDPLTVSTSDVIFYANHSAGAYPCAQVNKTGANAYTCDWATNITVQKGYYNTTMFAQSSGYYPNITYKLVSPGLFYLFPVYKVQSPNIVPTYQGWGYRNWNFSVIASSGDTDPYDVQLSLAKTSPTGYTPCSTCVNQTDISCFYPDCIDSTLYWYNNFTYQDVGTWFYKFELATEATSGFDSFTLIRDNVSIEYADGNESSASLTQATNLSVRVRDIIADRYNLSPSITVNFNLSYDGAYNKIANSTTTDEYGYANVTFIPDCNYNPGEQKWFAWVAGDSAYLGNRSENFTITLDLAGCNPSPTITQTLHPSETFQHMNFTINATLSSLVAQSSGVYVTLNVSDEWQTDGKTKYLGNIDLGGTKYVQWEVNATTPGTFNIPIFANNSVGNNDTDYIVLTNYKHAAPGLLEAVPSTIQGGGEKTFSFGCDAGIYRVANLTVDWNGNETYARVFSYNGTAWLDILHSRWLNTSGTGENRFIPILAEQISANESGYCTVRIRNIGSSNISVNALSLEPYYQLDLVVLDIMPEINGQETGGMEVGDGLFNVTFRIANSMNDSYMVNITLNITNSSGDVVDSTTKEDVSIDENSTHIENFTNIDTAGWPEGHYSLHAFVNGGTEANRSERFVYRNSSVSITGIGYMCNQTTEEFNVSVASPFNESIQYNVTLEMPAGWSYAPSFIVIDATEARTYTATFNVTSSSSAGETVQINASANYTYPDGLTKSRQSGYTIEEGESIPVLDVVRETPTLVANSTELISRLIIYNKGCAYADSIKLVEKVSSGWIAYGPNFPGSADIPKGKVTWDYGTEKLYPGFYWIASYKVLSNLQTEQTGTLRWNLTFGARQRLELSDHEVDTMQFTGEPHLAFDLDVVNGWGTRSANPHYVFNVTLTAKNIGDAAASANDWNVSLSIPNACNVTWTDGTEAGEVVMWQLPALAVGAETEFNLSLNCSDGQYVLVARGERDTINSTGYDENVYYSCTGPSCSPVSHDFQHPSESYERLSSIDFLVDYNFTGFDPTIGEGSVNITDDYDNYYRTWQHYDLGPSSGKSWSNYSMDSDEEWRFTSNQRKIGMYAYTDATYSEHSNVTISKLAYEWKYGTTFIEPENLYLNIKPYNTYPQLKNPNVTASGGGWDSINDWAVGGWGETFNFTVSVWDLEGGLVVTQANWSEPPYSVWNLIGEESLIVPQSSPGDMFNFTTNYSCSQADTFIKYKFTATDTGGTGLENETEELTFYVERDDAKAYNITPIWNATINRSSGFTVFLVQVNDTDNNEHVINQTDFGKIWISFYNDNTSFDSPGFMSTNDTGFMLRNVTHDDWCGESRYYLGQEYWKAGFYGKNCYKDNYTDAIPFMLTGILAPSMSTPDASSNYTKADTIRFNGTSVDDCG